MVEECFELVIRDQNRAVCGLLPLVLLPTETNLVPKEGYDKKYLSRHHSSSGSKVVLTLLIEIVVVYVRLSAIYVKRTGLQLISGLLGIDGSWGGSGSDSRSLSLQNGFKNLL